MNICDKRGCVEVVPFGIVPSGGGGVLKLGVGGCNIGVGGAGDDSIAITDGLEGLEGVAIKSVETASGRLTRYTRKECTFLPDLVFFSGVLLMNWM